MCRAHHSDNGDVGPCGQLCWWPAQETSLFFAPSGTPALFRCPLLHRAMSLGKASQSLATWMVVGSHLHELVHPSVCDSVFAKEREVLLGSPS